MNNADLKEWYSERYKNKIFFGTFPSGDESLGIETSIPSIQWCKQQILEIGCGVGFLAARLASHGALITAIDYSPEAIKQATEMFNVPFIRFRCRDFHEEKDKYDIVVSQGTWEHLDNPYDDIGFVMDNLLNEHGRFIFSTPNAANPRGYILKTLEKALDAEISDLHYLSLRDINDYCKEHNIKLTVKSSDHSWGLKERCVEDLAHRLVKYIGEEKAKQLIDWLMDVLAQETETKLNGANLICCLEKSNG